MGAVLRILPTSPRLRRTSRPAPPECFAKQNVSKGQDERALTTASAIAFGDGGRTRPERPSKYFFQIIFLGKTPSSLVSLSRLPGEALRALLSEPLINRAPGMGASYRVKVPNDEGNVVISLRQGCPLRGGI
jgi:hypothetical protein